MKNLKNIIETMKKMSGEELYLKAIEYKEKKDYCNYRMYLCMSANYGYEKAIQEHQYPNEFIYWDDFQNTDFSSMVNFCELTRNGLFSILEMSKMFSIGKYVPENKELAFQLQMESYEKGNKYAANNLGYKYQHGIGVKKDYQKAVEFYEISASFGCRDGLNNLGHIYLHGYWVIQNFEKAFELFQLAKNKGNWYANLALRVMYRDGKFVDQNYETAIDLLEGAASKGITNSYKHLSFLYQKYQTGRGEKKYVHEYFIKAGKYEYLEEIYGYTNEVLDIVIKNYYLEKENIKLKQENEEMKNHINASPEGPLYFEALNQWKLNSHDSRISPSTRV